jgi:hypothetical protein
MNTVKLLWKDKRLTQGFRGNLGETESKFLFYVKLKILHHCKIFYQENTKDQV